MKSESKPNVLVVGAGAWGTALANVFAKGGCHTFLWDKDDNLISKMQRLRHHPYICSNVPLESSVYPKVELKGLTVDAVTFVAPFQNLSEAAQKILEEEIEARFIVSASKGIEAGSLRLAHEIMACSFGDKPFAQVSGPSFAREVISGSPTAITVGTKSDELSSFLTKHLHAKSFRLYSTEDVVGVEIGGALKNVIAIAAGISDGLNLGSSARSALIVRGLSEIAKYGQLCGGEKDTFMGLSGLGDLVLTCSDDQSRNRRFGLELASKGEQIDAFPDGEKLVEGFYTASALAENKLITFEDFPIMYEIISIVKNHRSPRESLERLLSRTPKREGF